jgi:hypothetical protein
VNAAADAIYLAVAAVARDQEEVAAFKKTDRPEHLG